jgi:hypothetical protein
MNTDGWKHISVSGIANIRKCVGEFNVYELKKTPWAKFKVKIYEDKNGLYVGYTNLLLKDEGGSPYCGVGYGDTVVEALEKTIKCFMKMLDEKENLNEATDFESADPYDF